VYSYLVFRLCEDQAGAKARMVAVLRFDKKAVANAVAALNDVGQTELLARSWFASYDLG
jgi:hypothetical protein